MDKHMEIKQMVTEIGIPTSDIMHVPCMSYDITEFQSLLRLNINTFKLRLFPKAGA